MMNEITITRNNFHNTVSKLLCEEAKDNPFLGIAFALFGAKLETRIFNDNQENADTKAPFKSGDTVFVTSNDGDGNIFVNRVVTVNKVYDYDRCEVTDGEHEQRIYFKNLRKVKTS